jgi:hypothetical protein
MATGGEGAAICAHISHLTEFASPIHAQCYPGRLLLMHPMGWLSSVVCAGGTSCGHEGGGDAAGTGSTDAYPAEITGAIRSRGHGSSSDRLRRQCFSFANNGCRVNNERGIDNGRAERRRDHERQHQRCKQRRDYDESGKRDHLGRWRWCDASGGRRHASGERDAGRQWEQHPD